MFDFLRVTGLFFVTAVAEIIGCYLPWLVVTQGRPTWYLLPAAAALAAFAWLLTLHPSAAGRTYAAYGGVMSLSRSSGCGASTGSYRPDGTSSVAPSAWSAWRSLPCSPERQADEGERP